MPELTAALDRIGQTTRRLGQGQRNKVYLRTDDRRALADSAPAAISTQAPDLRMSTGVFKASYDEFVEGDFDLGIEQAIGSTVRPPGLEALLLRREALTPVCSPLLLQAGPPTRRLTWARS